LRYDQWGNLTETIQGKQISAATLAGLLTSPPVATLNGFTALWGTATQPTQLQRSVRTLDANGRLLSSTVYLDAGATETDSYVYDNMGRLTSQTHAGSAGSGVTAVTTTYKYDLQGRLIQQLGGRGSAALAALGASPTQAQIDAVWTAWADT
jgi:YD repeat-containing protein